MKAKKGKGYDHAEILKEAFAMCECPIAMFCRYVELVTNTAHLNTEVTQEALEKFIAGDAAALGRLPAQFLQFADWAATKTCEEVRRSMEERIRHMDLVNAKVQRAVRGFWPVQGKTARAA